MMSAEQLHTELLAFMNYLESRDLSVCFNFSRNGAGFWPVNVSNTDLVAAYMNVKTGGIR